MAALKRHRGVGSVETPAEPLQAGGSALAVKLHDINQRVVRTEQWPVAWAGGRIAGV